MKRASLLVTSVALALVMVSQGASLRADPATVSQLNWIFDGTVQSSARLGNTLYVGGTFTAVAPAANVLPPIYALSDTTGAVVAPRYAVFDGSVAAVESDGAGGYFIGGDFALTNGGPRVYLAHVLTDGSVDATFAPVIDAGVVSLARIGATLYVADEFRVGAVSAVNGARVAWVPLLPSSTRPAQILAAGDRVVVTGADSQPMVRSANVWAFDAVSAAELWFAYLSGGVRSPSRPGPALIAGARLIVGHGRGLSNLSLTTGAADASWDPQVSPAAIALSGTTLYLGGGFTSVAGQARAHLAAIDVNTAALLPWQPSVPAPVTSMAVSSTGTVFVSGGFSTIGGLARHHLAAIDASGAVTPWIADARPDTATLTAAPGTLLVSSSIAATGNVPRSHLAAFDLTSGALLPWAPVSVEPVQFLAATVGRVYAGVSGSVLVLDPPSGTQLEVLPATVAIAAHAPWIYWATSAGGAAATVRRADLATGSVDPSWRPATFVPRVIAQDGDALYFASATAGLAAVDARTARVRWANPAVVARHVVASGATLVAGDGIATVATVDARTGASLGAWPTTFHTALAEADGRVMVGSASSGFAPRTPLAAYTFGGRPVAWDGALEGAVGSLAVAGDVLVAGGTLATRSPRALRGLAVYPLLGAVAPANLRARPTGTATEFTWDAPAAAPAGYVVEAGLASGQTVGTVTLGNVTTFSVEVLPGAYYVRVRTSGGGADAVSNEVLVRGGCTAPPPHPRPWSRRSTALRSRSPGPRRTRW